MKPVNCELVSQESLLLLVIIFRTV